MKVFFDISGRWLSACKDVAESFSSVTWKKLPKHSEIPPPGDNNAKREKQRDNDKIEDEEPLVGSPDVDVISSQLR